MKPFPISCIFLSLATATAPILVTGCESIPLQATSQTDRPASTNKPGSARFVNTHETHYVEEFALRADRREQLRTKGLWVTRKEAEALGVDTTTVQEGDADSASGQVVKTGEGENERFFLPPKPLKRHMHARRPGNSKFVSGSTRFNPDAQ